VRGAQLHKQTVVACVRVAAARTARHEVRTFATTAAGLRALQEWLVAAGCTHAVLASTGVYWKAVWHRLADSLTLVLANATAVRNLPARKSDVSDAQWLADLLAHGLVRGSFVPPAPIQALARADPDAEAAWAGSEKIGRSMRVFGVRPCQPAARRV
jgi:transposase